MAKNYTLALRKSMKQLGTYRPEYESAIAIAAQLMEQYDELFGDSPILGINEPAPRMNIWGRPIQTENDLVEIYEKCL